MPGINSGSRKAQNNDCPSAQASLPRRCKVAAKKCFFFKLPAELRNVIYEAVLTVDPKDVIRLVKRHDTHKPHTSTESIWSHDKLEWVERQMRHRPTVLCLLAVNQQIRSEAIGIFQDVNHFLIGLDREKENTGHGDIAPSLQSMKQIDARSLAGFRRITLDVDDGDTTLEAASLACKKFADLPRLKELRIIACMGDIGEQGPRTWHWRMATREKDILKTALSKLQALEVFEVEFDHYGVVSPLSKEQLDGLIAELRAALPKEKSKKGILKVAKA